MVTRGGALQEALNLSRAILIKSVSATRQELMYLVRVHLVDQFVVRSVQQSAPLGKVVTKCRLIEENSLMQWRGRGFYLCTDGPCLKQQACPAVGGRVVQFLLRPLEGLPLSEKGASSFVTKGNPLCSAGLLTR